MVASILLALSAVSARDFAAHGKWMTRAYAVGAASGTQFFTVAPYVLALGGRSVPITASLMILGWAINLVVAEATLRRPPVRAPRPVRGAVVLALLFGSLVPSRARADEPGDLTKKALLDAAAESAHDKRVADGVGAVACGVTFGGVGVASWVTESTANARGARDILGGVFVGLGSVMIMGGTYALLSRTELERQRDAYVPSVGERVLMEHAAAAKTERYATGVVSFVFAIAEITAGIAIETSADDPGVKWLGRGLIAGGVGAGILGTSSFAIRSEEERLADLWRHERSPSPSSVKLVPRLGLGQIGLAGRF